MIVEDQLDRRMGRIGGVEELEEFDEFAASVAVLDEGVDLAGEQIDARQQADRAVAPLPPHLRAQTAASLIGLSCCSNRSRRLRSGETPYLPQRRSLKE